MSCTPHSVKRSMRAGRSIPERVVLITCEHGGNDVPVAYRPLFARHHNVLESHRGYDPGALHLARELARALGAKLIYSTTTRLLVELNRSPGHSQTFSEMTRDLGTEERRIILERYYRPYREAVESYIGNAIARGATVVHLSSHSFTPRLHGRTRRADVGLLYDPRRAMELEIVLAWKHALEAAAATLRVRRNYPYRGTSDGLTTYLRTRFPPRRYAGIELEVNQKYPLGDPRAWRAMRSLLVTTFREALAHEGHRTSLRAGV